MTRNTNARQQLYRYLVVGVATNVSMYLLYLGLTAVGLPPKLAMSILYMAGVLQTFIFNRSWTFRYVGNGHTAFRRHVLLYVGGYLLNYLLLTILVDALQWQHQYVMAGLVAVMAILFFLGQKFWVFRRESVTTTSG